MKKFTKYHKQNSKILKKITITNKSKQCKFIKYYLLITQKSGYLTKNEIETIKLLLKQNLVKQTYKFSIKANFYLTKKPIETRMGKGKGPLDKNIIWVKKGHNLIIFYSLNYTEWQLINKIKKKISIKTELYNFNKWLKVT